MLDTCNLVLESVSYMNFTKRRYSFELGNPRAPTLQLYYMYCIVSLYCLIIIVV